MSKETRLQNGEKISRDWSVSVAIWSSRCQCSQVMKTKVCIKKLTKLNRRFEKIGSLLYASFRRINWCGFTSKQHYNMYIQCCQIYTTTARMTYVTIKKSIRCKLITSGVNILAQIMKLFPYNIRIFSAFLHKSSLISLFIETFPL